MRFRAPTPEEQRIRDQAHAFGWHPLAAGPICLRCALNFPPGFGMFFRLPPCDPVRAA